MRAARVFIQCSALAALCACAGTHPAAGGGGNESGPSLAPGEIRPVMDSARAAVTHCYEQGLASNAALTGRVMVRFVIGLTGAVIATEVPETTLHAPAVESCIVAVVSRLTFPRPRVGIVNVNYPYDFHFEADDAAAPAHDAAAEAPLDAEPAATVRIEDGGRRVYVLNTSIVIADDDDAGAPAHDAAHHDAARSRRR